MATFLKPTVAEALLIIDTDVYSRSFGNDSWFNSILLLTVCVASWSNLSYEKEESVAIERLSFPPSKYNTTLSHLSFRVSVKVRMIIRKPAFYFLNA